GYRAVERHEPAPNPESARRCADRLYSQALGDFGLYTGRTRPPFLRIVRVIGTQECAALGRHLGAGFAPVQGLRGLLAAGSALRRSARAAESGIGDPNRLRRLSRIPIERFG